MSVSKVYAGRVVCNDGRRPFVAGRRPAPSVCVEGVCVQGLVVEPVRVQVLVPESSDD